MKKFWTATKNIFKALRNGEFLLRIRADKYYLHIMYLFLLMWLSILLSLRVDKTLATAGRAQDTPLAERSRTGKTPERIGNRKKT